jgi:pilus assembly protein Flp/PilA
METFKQFLRDEAGVTAIEYALIAALIAVAIVTAVTQLGTKVSTTFDDIKTNL